jgi:hypothetical protein
MCFSIETLDQYVMARLREPDRTVLALHLAKCRDCREIVEESKAMIAVVLLAARQPQADIDALIDAGPERTGFVPQAPWPIMRGASTSLGSNT